MASPTARAVDYVEPGCSERHAALIAAVLSPDSSAIDAPLAVTEADWESIWKLFVRHRIETFLVPAIESGAVVVPDACESVVRRRNRKLVMRRLRLLNALNEFIALCAAESIEVRVLKGLATGQLDHVSPNHRRTSDIDVLVSQRDFRRITDLVAEGAFEFKADAPSEVLVERTFRMANKVQLDIHHRLFRFGRGHEDVLFDAPTPLPSGGLAMRREARLVHAAAHLLISPPGHRIMSSLADVAVISQHPDCDLDVASGIARRFGVDDVLAHAIWIAQNIGRANPEPEPDAAATLINRAHLRTDRRVDLETLAQLRDLSGIRDRWTLLRYQVRRVPRGI